MSCFYTNTQTHWDEWLFYCSIVSGLHFLHISEKAWPFGMLLAATGSWGTQTQKMLTASHLAFWTFVPCCVTPSSSPVSLSELLWTCHRKVWTVISIHFLTALEPKLTALEPKLQVTSIKRFPKCLKDSCNYHNSVPSIQPLCALLSFTSWLFPNLAQCSNSITQNSTRTTITNYSWLSSFLPIPKLSASFLSCWKAENLTTCSQLISLEQAKLLTLRHAAIVARNSQCTSVQTNCTAVKWRHLPFYLENLCGSATEYFGHTEKQQKDTKSMQKLTKPKVSKSHTDLLSGFGVTLIRRQAHLPMCGFTASFIRSEDILKKYLRSSLSSLKRSHQLTWHSKQPTKYNGYKYVQVYLNRIE